MRIFINGFGRIGRSVLRAWAETPGRWPGLTVAGINDIADPDMCAYLFRFDSVFGPFRGRAARDGDALAVDGRRIPLHRAADLSALDLRGIDVVMECAGHCATRAIAERGLRAGAARVLVSGPCAPADLTVVRGANDAALGAQPVVSNASCTTNAVAPLLRCLDDAFGIVTGSMTTIHCYTGSQPVTDAPGPDFARSRAAALSMVPTTTSAGALVDRVLPHLAGRVIAQAVRVPVASVSAVDLTVQLARPATVAAVNGLLAAAGGVIGTTDLPLVSSDLRARPESVVMALLETRAAAQGLLRVFGWYDNEWGFSNRMLDVALRMG